MSPTLQPTISPPIFEAGLTEAANVDGFLRLTNFFRPFDGTFVRIPSSRRVARSVKCLDRLQDQLWHALPSYLHITTHQTVDLEISKQWLHEMLSFVADGDLCPCNWIPHESSSARATLDMSCDLMTTYNAFTCRATGYPEFSMLVKLLEITDLFMDIICFLPLEDVTNDPGPREYLASLNLLF